MATNGTIGLLYTCTYIQSLPYSGLGKYIFGVAGAECVRRPMPRRQEPYGDGSADGLPVAKGASSACAVTTP